MKGIIIMDEFNQEKIAVTAAVSMYGATLFVIFQFIILLIPIFISIIIEDKYLMIGSYVIFTIIEILLITRKIKQKYNFEVYYITKEENSTFSFSERKLQIMFNITAIVGIIWIKLINNGSGIKYFFIVINSFSIIYFFIFVVTRLKIEKRISYAALISIIIATIQIYLGLTGKGLAI